MNAPNWIPVNEALPVLASFGVSVDVLVTDGSSVYAAYLCNMLSDMLSDGELSWQSGDWPIRNVTHWMPLPAPPAQSAALLERT